MEGTYPLEWDLFSEGDKLLPPREKLVDGRLCSRHSAQQTQENNDHLGWRWSCNFTSSTVPLRSESGPRSIQAYTKRDSLHVCDVCDHYELANFRVHSAATLRALSSSSTQARATCSLRGSSGLGAERRAWMERRMVRIWRAGDHLSFNTSRQIRPTLSMLGW